MLQREGAGPRGSQVWRQSQKDRRHALQGTILCLVTALNILEKLACMQDCTILEAIGMGMSLAWGHINNFESLDLHRAWINALRSSGTLSKKNILLDRLDLRYTFPRIH